MRECSMPLKPLKPLAPNPFTLAKNFLFDRENIRPIRERARTCNNYHSRNY